MANDRIITSGLRSRAKDMRSFPKPKFAGFGGASGIAKTGNLNEFGTEGQFLSSFSPEIRNPTLNPEQFFLPKFISTDGSPNQELNTWFEHYMRWHPLVGNLIGLHATLPLSRFGLVGITDPTVLNFFEQMAEDLQIFETSINMLKGYFGRGEVQPLGKWDDDKGKWVKLVLLDTNHVNVTGHQLLYAPNGESTEIYEYTPDEYLHALLKSENPEEQKLLDYLDDEIKYAIENNYSLILDPFSTTMLRNKLNPWDLRGTSMLCNILKLAMIEDKLREQMRAYAEANINPIRLWKIGNDNFIANEDQISAIEQLIRTAQYDPQFNVITHHLLNFEIHGAVGQVDKMKDDFEYIENQILTALWASKAFTHSEGVTYNSSSMAMRVLMGRYIPIRTMLENYFYQKIFLPVSLKQDFYKTTPKNQPNGQSAMILPDKKDRELWYPLFDWRHKQSLLDDQSIRSMLVQLQEASKMPMRVICDSLDIDYDYVKTWLEKEMNTVFDNDMIAGKKVITQSAMAGGLKDTGIGIVKRLVEASSAWVKAITGKNENVALSETDKAKEIKKDDLEKNKENENTPAMPPSTEPLTGNEEAPENPAVKQQRLKYGTKYVQDQLKAVDSINRVHFDEVKNQLEKKRAGKSGIVPIVSSKDIILKTLSNHYFDQTIIKQVQDELYDLKLMCAKEGKDYITGVDSIQNHIDRITSFLEKGYNQRLYNVNKVIAVKTGGLLGKDNYTDFIIPDFESKLALSLKVGDIETKEKQVKKAHWEAEVYPKLEQQVLDNFVKMSKLSEIDIYKKCGIKDVYVNNAKTDITKLSEASISDLGTKITPDTGFKARSALKLSNANIINVPLELKYKVLDTAKKIHLTGNFNLDKISEIGDSDYIESIVDTHVKNIFSRIKNMDEVTELFAKYYGDEEGESQWFDKHAHKFIHDKEEIEELNYYFSGLF